MKREKRRSIELPPKLIVKKIVSCFGISFLLLFLAFLVNQVLLVTVFAERQYPFSRVMLLLLYSLPAMFVLVVPFAVGIGFVQGIIRIYTMGAVAFKKILVPVLCVGLTISVVDFVFMELTLPGANIAFGALYGGGGSPEKHPREMKLPELARAMSGLRQAVTDGQAATGGQAAAGGFDGRLNRYQLEFNKKFAITLGAALFAFFAAAFSAFKKLKPIIALGISGGVCVLYWAAISYGELYAIRSGHFGVLAMWLPDILLLCVSLALYAAQRRPVVAVPVPTPQETG
jgi:lipopolysaccharide export LptBFGC system permease protein LptF